MKDKIEIAFVDEDIEEAYFSQVYVEFLYSEIELYKSRCEKAIEYINHENFKRTVLVGVGTKKYTRNILDNVLNILQGEDTNVNITN